MSSRENAAVELATAIVKVACSLLTGGIPDAASSVTDILHDKIKGALERRRIERIFDSCADVIADRLLQVLQLEFRDVPDHDRIAAILAAQDTLLQGEVTLRGLIQADLDARTVEHNLTQTAQLILPGYALGDSARELFRLILRESSAYLVEAATLFPEFQSEALRQLLARDTRLAETLERVLRQLPQRRGIDAFEEDYCRIVANKLDRMQIFGITSLTETSRNYPLSVAYVSLSVSHWNRSNKHIHSTGQRVERALAGENRILLVGDAGSGKTTLLRWLAVTASRGNFGDSLEDWNECVPFLVSLRRYADGNLPEPSQFINEVARNLVSDMPEGWTNGLLRSGRALILIDGIDEVRPGRPRTVTREWLSDLVHAFPRARYVATSRTTAIGQEWQSFQGFVAIELQPMSPSDVSSFVAQWHAAMARSVTSDEELERIPGDQRSILSAIAADRHLRALAVNPLLCAMLCALNREWNRRLPRERMDIYEAALTMLLGSRDRVRGVDISMEISTASQVLILQELALWLVSNGWSDVPRERIIARIATIMRSLPRMKGDPEEILRYLLERTGLLRDPAIGRIDFVHRTFQEYLAAKAAVDTDQIGQLIANAHDDQWHEVVVMASGHARPQQSKELIRGILDRGVREPNYQHRMRLLALACMQTARQLEPSLKAEVEEVARELIPPKSNEIAEQLAALGELVIDALSNTLPTNSEEAVACVRAAALIGTPEALTLIGRFAVAFPEARNEALSSWRFFEPVQYARLVLSNAGPVDELEVSEAVLVTGLEHVQGLKRLVFYVPPSSTPESINLDSLTRAPDLEEIYLDCEMKNLRLDAIARCDKLSLLTIRQARCWRFRDLSFRRPPLLGELRLLDCSELRSLSGLEDWNGLIAIRLARCPRLTDLSAIGQIDSLEKISIESIPNYELKPFASLPSLRELRLETLNIVNLFELKGKANLTITVPRNAKLRGEDSLGKGTVVIRTL